MTEATPLASEQITDPKHIYLQPQCCVDPHGEGRQWCEDDGGWEECYEEGCQCKSVRYVREDLAALSASPAPSGQAGCPECGFNTCLCDGSPNNPNTAIEYPAGAIENGREFLRRLGEYDCAAGPISMSVDYMEAVRCFEWLAMSCTSLNAAPSGQGASGERRCAASPDHADILETIKNAADDWQRKGYTSALAEVRDMANVGRALMEALPEGYSYNDCPSEIVADLQNERDEALAAPAPSCAPGEVERLKKAAEMLLWQLERSGRTIVHAHEMWNELRDAAAALSPQGLDAKEGGE